MAKMISISVDLPDDLLLALGRASRQAGCQPAAYLRAALERALLRPGMFDLAARVNETVALARDWIDLQQRLRGEGFVLRLLGSDEVLWLCSWPENHRLCRAADAGVDLAGLCLRFRADFPGRGLHIAKPVPAPQRATPHAA
jgi:hypothetical protein